MLKPKTSIKIKKIKTDRIGRYILVEIEVNNGQYLLANVYAPNQDSSEFFGAFSLQIEEMSIDQLILTGDFNLALDPLVDKQGGSENTHVNARKILTAFIEEKNLIDVWRWQHPDGFKFTWKRLPPSPVYVRLDYIFIPGLTAQWVLATDILPGYKTDHSTPLLKLKLQNAQRGPGHWKFNVSLLDDELYVQQLGKVIDIETKSERNKITALEQKLVTIENSLHKFSVLANPFQQMAEIKKELEDIVAIKTRGAMIRCCAKWMEMGEKSSKYFFQSSERQIQ